MLSDFLSLIFSETCASCKSSLFKNEQFICLRCLHQLPKTNFHDDIDNLLARRLWGKTSLTHVMAYLKFVKEGIAQKLLYEIKYKGKKEGARLLGNWYGHDLKGAGFQNRFDAIVPVPLHSKRFAKRGFNQSLYFAEGLSESLGSPILENVLIRSQHKSSQTGMGRFDRWRNVSDVYEIKNGELIKDKHILLVDDVITSGATIEVCAEKLGVAGVDKLSCAAIAVAM